MTPTEMRMYFDEPAMHPREIALMQDADRATACIRAALAELAKMGPAAVGVGAAIMEAEEALERALDRLQF